MTEELTGAEITIRCLQEEGVEYIFGYPGGAVLFIYDELFKQDKVKHILVRHEQAALHAADGYARSSHKVGVALVTSGPGVTNAVTGIATAYMDSIPLVIISGQVPTAAIGQDAFQEVDTVGITRPCVKHNFLVKDITELATTIKKAFFIASSGRPGPVLVDIPKDVTQQKTHFSYPSSIRMRSYNPVTNGNTKQIKKAAELILSAKRPMFYSGGGVILDNAAGALTELVQLLDYPCTNTLMGLGGYPATDKHFVGMLGMHGTYEANMSMQYCDVLIARIPARRRDARGRIDDRAVPALRQAAGHLQPVCAGQAARAAPSARGRAAGVRVHRACGEGAAGPGRARHLPAAPARPAAAGERHPAREHAGDVRPRAERGPRPF